MKKTAIEPKPIITPTYSQVIQRLREVFFIIIVGTAIFFLVSLLTYHHHDPAWSYSGLREQPLNAGGKAGAWTSDILLSLFGYPAYTFPLIIMAFAWFWLRHPATRRYDYFLWLLRFAGFFLLLSGLCGIGSVQLPDFAINLSFGTGGMLGKSIQHSLINNFNSMGTSVLLITAILMGVTLCGGFSWLTILEKIGSLTLSAGCRIMILMLAPLQSQQKEATETDLPLIETEVTEEEGNRTETRIEPKLQLPAQFTTDKSDEKQYLQTIAVAAEPKVGVQVTHLGLKNRINTPSTSKPNFTAPQFNKDNFSKGKLPSLELLDKSTKPAASGYSRAILETMSHEVEQRLLDFGVEVQVVAVYPGPVITRFELQLAPGIKVSKIVGLAKDLARSLSVTSVRVVDVIPGKSVIGVEVPNEHREMVRLREVLESNEYSQAKSSISMALGKDIAGHPVIVDLAKMPHLLVAGTTGAGKSVGLNIMLLSILYKASPEEVRMILIDPKMLELSIYDKIPHLLTPVVTDMKEAANALRWCVAEMERRYKLMAAFGVRNITGFNLKIKEAASRREILVDPLWQATTDLEEEPPALETLPYIVVVVDEFADMMMVVGKKVEDLIARIAQKARAAGIHLILATQRPSVDVITGLIKANIPTRIAFQVSSRIDSRTILDQQGAEQLLGQGDMLYLPPGTGVPIRVHGAFVDDHEVHKVADDWRKRSNPQYIKEVTTFNDGSDGGNNQNNDANGELDALYDEAVRIVTESRRASISLIQRKLRIGYNRAARILETMEAAGVVSTMESNGTREVLAPPPVE